MIDKDVITMEATVSRIFKTKKEFENFNPRVLRVTDYERIKKLTPGYIRNKYGSEIEFLIFQDENDIVSKDKIFMFEIRLKDKLNVGSIIKEYFENNP